MNKLKCNACAQCGIISPVKRTLYLIAVFLSPLILSRSAAQAPEAEVLVARKLCDLQDPRINESSGLAASHRYAAQSLLWTHNDSAGETELFCIDPFGRTVATLKLSGAKNIDWEDMEIAGDWMYIADVGDNLRHRESVTIYRLREPEFDPNKAGATLGAASESMTLKYPEGARDCETLLVTTGGEVLLVSKNGGASKIYKAPQPFANGATQTLEEVGEYSFTGATALSYLTTAGSLSPDETRVVIRTYTHAYEWTIPAQNNWRDLWKAEPRIFELPQTQQGEAICFSADGLSFFVTSEQLPTPLFLLERE